MSFEVLSGMSITPIAKNFTLGNLFFAYRAGKNFANDISFPAYLTHAPCFKNITLAEEKCAPKYRRLIELSENVNEEHDVDEGLKDSCCAFREFVLCKYIHVAQDCGHDADAFLQQHLDRITSPLLHEHCAHYTYGAGTCTSTSNNLRPALNLSMILTLFFFTEKLLRYFFASNLVNG
ncbi:uncharacterized protein CDAR_217141 [Caerostris darwini]|uniref:Uncharacterized protein n=1 Tax=Caerostris darwini TaxID=1538125 RepID=A0AAV4UTS8_9ARAC|nr:uncharacterized protein CDAR_217141 [Caerostris darwini]